MKRPRAAVSILMLGALGGAPLLAADPTPAPALRDARTRIALSGTWAAGSLTFDSSRTLVAFAEDGRLAAEYAAEGGPGFEGLVQYRVTRRFGLAGAFTLATRDTAATVTAELPHPFYFGRPRGIEGRADGLELRERAGHLDLVVVPVAGRLEAALFGGVTLFDVQGDLVGDVQYDQAYPYDSATFRSAVTDRVHTKPVGWNAGASLDWRFAAHFGLGLQGRYSRGRAKTEAGGAPVSFDVGGFQAAAGLRLFF